MHDLDISYLEKLKRRREATQALKDTTKPPPLHERIEKWYDDLPDDDKRRSWKMEEFTAIFGETPQQIAASLWNHGWSRRRSSKDSKPTSRFWYKE